MIDTPEAGDPHDTAGLADRLAAAEVDNARLRRLLDDAGLRHGLRDTLALLRAIVRRSVEGAGDVEGYAAHLEGRLDAIGRVRVRLDAFGEIDLHTLVSDELLTVLVHEGEQAVLDGPGVRLRPKAAQVMALAVHELASNAVEHGTLSGPGGRVAVRWSVEADGTGPVLALVWQESGDGVPVGPLRRGFGTVVLEEMLAYDLAGHAVLAYAPDGLRFTLRLPLTGRVGRLAEGEGFSKDDIYLEDIEPEGISA